MNKISITVSLCHNDLKVNMMCMILHSHFSFTHNHSMIPSPGGIGVGSKIGFCQVIRA